MSEHENKDTNTEPEFNFTENESFQHTLKQTRRQQMKKYIMFGTITTIILLFLVYLAGSYSLQLRIAGQYDTSSEFQGANVAENGTRFYYPAFSAIAETEYIKIIGGRPIVWNVRKKEYPMFGPSNIVSGGGGTGIYNTDEERMIMYNSHTGDRELDFYHPNATYQKLPNNLEFLDEIDSTTLVEFALSFDKAYTLDEVEELLGRENVNWVWVDSYSDTDIKDIENSIEELGEDYTISGHSVNGFDVSSTNTIDRKFPKIRERADQFISNISYAKSTGDYKDSAAELFNSLRGEDNKLTVEDVKIIGAVVTGDKEDLKRFQELEFIRASTLGATVPKY